MPSARDYYVIVSNILGYGGVIQVIRNELRPHDPGDDDQHRPGPGASRLAVGDTNRGSDVGEGLPIRKWRFPTHRAKITHEQSRLDILRGH